jgi:hypothetical protein
VNSFDGHTVGLRYKNIDMLAKIMVEIFHKIELENFSWIESMTKVEQQFLGLGKVQECIAASSTSPCKKGSSSDGAIAFISIVLSIS